MQKINIFWFRRDLRLEDNTGLYYALREEKPVLPVFIFDREILDDLNNPSDARVGFIHQRLVEIDRHLKIYGSGIKTFYTQPLEAFRELLSQYEIDSVFTNRDYEPYAINRDQKVEAMLSENGISFYSFKDHVIFEKKEICTDSGEPYKVFTPYKNKWIEKFKNTRLEEFDSFSRLKNTLKNQDISIHSLESMGFKESQIEIPPLEFDNQLIKKYDQLRNFPGTKGTTRLGIHLRHGSVSVRKSVNIAAHLNDTWLNELIWREFYSMVLYNYPHVVGRAFKPKYDNIPWRNDAEDFEKWCKGKTGYPIVDAGMRELNATGYMHNRVRMITASFLTKHLLIDWRMGESYFAQKLLDYELASNNGGWQWAAGTGTDAQPYFRIFNPYSQTEKFDKELKYVKKWVPELGTDLQEKPIIDHTFARNRALEVFKKALN
ncbi:MAG: deoxyribodipyrimidine photo-lyase [Cyclobacteriaceae bacterium]|nr:deoxyribodipyrimidine photo-lyase [Cyclobacteriaceae bacterium]